MAIAIAVCVPALIVGLGLDILPTTAVSLALMAVTILLVVGGDRMVGYRLASQPVRLPPEPGSFERDDRPFMLADAYRPAAPSRTRDRHRATA